MDLLLASAEARVCLSVLRAERNDDKVWDALVEKATSIAEVYKKKSNHVFPDDGKATTSQQR